MQGAPGTVIRNNIEGIFEISPVRYDGAGAQPFPPDYQDQEDLQRYLEPSLLIESNDEILAAKAREITTGSDNCWAAACTLSRWVGQEIGPAIPGGSARQTYDKGGGECASHSRLLAAFCRSVGIPTRLATGCMYTGIYDGSFGQHVWNEIYMGEAGWIPVDATVHEYDFIDAGHIRLGELTSFNPSEMEILEFALKPKD